jgi:hypothetical protein
LKLPFAPKATTPGPPGEQVPFSTAQVLQVPGSAW